MVIDFCPINQLLKRSVKWFAGSEQIKKDLNPKAKCYAVIDMTSGYYQIPLKEEFRDLTTFIIPRGHFRFHEVPMGMRPASDIFNNWTDPCSKNIDECHKQMDDMMIEGLERP